MKYIVFAKASGAADTLQRSLLDSVANCEARGLETVAVNLVVDPDAIWDAVIEVWTDSRTTLPALESALRPTAAHIATYGVTELVGKDEGPVRGWPTVGVKTVVPWIARSEISAATCRRHWDEHVELANRIHVGVTRYLRNWVDTPAPGTSIQSPPYRGIASQHFLSNRDLEERMFDRPGSEQLIAADVAEFLAEHEFLLTTEYYRNVAGGRGVQSR